MGDEYSTLQPIRPNKGKAQWTRANFVRTEINDADRVKTHIMEVPYLMPGTIIFVHGVNSEGEWYPQAARQFNAGLNKRLGRTCLEDSRFERATKRFTGINEAGKRARSPIIPFYWGYKLQLGDEKRYPGIFHGEDGAWGGGPFQNGTNNLLQFWRDGFKRSVLGGLIDLQRLNADITRQLQDAPARAYFVHAARRLANLIDTIREDFPNEPLNIVAHSQGNMIALCAMLYLQRRAPDTLILNSAPYSFDAKITDWLAMSNGWADVQSPKARLRTFEAVARKIAAAATDYKDDEANEKCGHEGAKGFTTVHVHHEPERDDWHQQIGGGAVNGADQKWHECEHASHDNRGKVFVNFNPHDRVIGIAAIEGIGWRGIPESILSAGGKSLPNVYQRVFARNSGVGDVPAVGAKTNYWFSYFHTQMNMAEDVTTESGARLVTSDGSPVQTQNDYLKTYDGKHASKFWNIVPDKIAGLFGVQSTPTEQERVWINAPIVPVPAVVGEDFDEGAAAFDGRDTGDAEQQEDFATYSRHYVPERVTVNGPRGTVTTRQETADETAARLARYGKQPVPKTNHGQILRYGGLAGQDGLVEKIISYDLTIGQGYAFGDADYWQYLLDLADWKVSDPYYQTGGLPPAGSPPAGLDTATVVPKPG
jgi:pimeloyl-ACP methyl ester carboxylesterase